LLTNDENNENFTGRFSPRNTRNKRKGRIKETKKEININSVFSFFDCFACFAGNKTISQENKKRMSEIIYKEESYKIVGACFEVYKQKGCGFLESVYHECLKIEFEMRNISFVSQPEIQLEYKGRLLEQYFQPDFVCFDKNIVELKAVANLINEHRAQTMNYLSATKFELALLVNFGHYPKLEYERFANNKRPQSLSDEIKSWSQ
jgi:GxxExxY protein